MKHILTLLFTLIGAIGFSQNMDLVHRDYIPKGNILPMQYPLEEPKSGILRFYADDTLRADAMKTKSITGATGYDLNIWPNDKGDFGFYERGRVNVFGNLTVAAGLGQYGTIYGGAGNPGKARLVFADNKLMVVLRDVTNSIDIPVYGKLEVGAISAVLPTYSSNSDAKAAGLKENDLYKTPKYRTIRAVY